MCRLQSKTLAPKNASESVKIVNIPVFAERNVFVVIFAVNFVPFVILVGKKSFPGWPLEP
jgi:hypothetical protein